MEGGTSIQARIPWNYLLGQILISLSLAVLICEIGITILTLKQVMKVRDNVGEAPAYFLPRETVATKYVISAQTLLFLTCLCSCCLSVAPPLARFTPTYPITLAQGLLSPGRCPCFSPSCNILHAPFYAFMTSLLLYLPYCIGGVSSVLYL